VTEAVDHAVREARARLRAQVAEALERSLQRLQDAPALWAHTDVVLDALALQPVEVVIQVVGQVRVRPFVLAHEAASLKQATDH
jgi:hypothetical protein